MAWELAATAHPNLGRVEADRTYIALGIGEALAAIEALIAVVAQNHIALTDELLATVVPWLGACARHNAEPRQRELLTCVGL